MNTGIQKKFEQIGNYGCYFLCLLKAADVKKDRIIELYDYFLSKKWIDEECTILQPTMILKYLTYKNYRVEKTTEYKDSDIAVAYFYNPRTKLHHFVLKDKNGFWDSLGNSVTVKEGYVESWRLFTLY